MKTRIFAILFLAASLGACVSAEEYKKMQEAKIAEEASRDDAQCRSYGAERGSVGYFNCRQNLFSLRQAKEQYESQQTAIASQNLMQNGIQMLNQSQYQPRQSLNCTTTKQGVFLNTNCY